MAEQGHVLTINDIPSGPLLHIFTFLDAISLCKVRRVCRAWNYLCTDEILWKDKLMKDVKSWKHVSSNFSTENEDGDASKYDVYMSNSPEIQTWKRNAYQRTTMHQLTDMLRRFMPTKRFSFGVGATAMDSYGRGQSFFSKLLSPDAANCFQYLTAIPGHFQGHGAGCQFKYKRHLLDLCLMYLAPKELRKTMTFEQKMLQLKEMMKSKGYLELLGSWKGYLHTIDSMILEGSSEESTKEELKKHAEEIAIIEGCLKPSVPILVLSVRKVHADVHLSSFDVSNCLNLSSLSRPWMVCECSVEMLYRDIVDAMDWIIATATPLL